MSIMSGSSGISFSMYGGSAKMMSNLPRHVLIYLKASPRTTIALVSCSLSRKPCMKRQCRVSFSILITREHPRDSSSRVMLPVPAKRSSAIGSFPQLMYPFRTLNRFSLAKSVVGRALKVRGTSKCRPLYFPVITLIGYILSDAWFCIILKRNCLGLYINNEIPDEGQQLLRSIIQSTDVMMCVQVEKFPYIQEKI